MHWVYCYNAQEIEVFNIKLLSKIGNEQHMNNGDRKADRIQGYV